VSLRHGLLPFLQPNKYVNYTAEGAVADLALELLRECPIATTKAVFNYVRANIRYDFTLVNNGVPCWYEPDLEELVTVTRRGICFDFASLMTAILRLNNIPAKMAFGWTQAEGEERFFHAWVYVYLSDFGWVFFDPTLRVGDLRFMPANPIRGKTSVRSLAYLSFDAVKYF
jgi:transglutaminase-like putative cysteine protease